MDKDSEAVVEIESGRIEGNYLDGLYIFRGIPYAAPPVGNLRWLVPQPVEPWEGIRPARAFGTIAPQTVMENPAMDLIRIVQPQDEDCLYLNVWSPGLDDARRPVMVWIHGGAFHMGSGSEPTSSATKLAVRGDVVVVSINYRLGLLGFLNLNEITGGKIPSTGNEGLLDQIAALRWVRDNIAAFGGNPENVTVFGESAGGMSIGCLLAMPQAEGLFHKAILQSGVGSTVSLLEAGVMLSGRFLELLGLDSDDIEALRSLTVEQLLDANQELRTRMARKEEEDMRITVTAPVVDGRTLPDIPIDAVRRGSAAGIPTLAGTNLEEWKLLCLMDSGLPSLDEAGMIRRFQYYFSAEHIPGLAEAYRKARSGRGADTSVQEIYKAIQTDRMFRMPCIKFVEAQSLYNPSTYNYLFTWESPALGGILGACHGLDIGFVFGTYDPAFHGSGLEADRLSMNMQDAWLAFARTGNPSCESIGDWQPYGERRMTMILGKDCYLAEAPYDEERRAWDSVPDVFTGEIRVDD